MKFFILPVPSARVNFRPRPGPPANTRGPDLIRRGGVNLAAPRDGELRLADSHRLYAAEARREGVTRYRRAHTFNDGPEFAVLRTILKAAGVWKGGGQKSGVRI